MLWLAASAPGCTFVLDHVGSPPVLGPAAQLAAWRADIALLGGLPNVYVKVGGLYQYFQARHVLPTLEELTPLVAHCLASFGYSRALFEGNWFFVDWRDPAHLDTYALWAQDITAIVAALNATADEEEQLFWGAGARAYRVE